MRPARLAWLLLLTCLALPCRATGNETDSLKALAAAAPHDTARAKFLNQVGTAFFGSDLDSALHYWNAALAIGEEMSKSEDEAVRRAGKMQVMRSSSNVGIVLQYRGLYPVALRQYQRCLRLAQELADERGTLIALNNIGLIKMGQEKPDEALDYFQRSQAIAERLQDSTVISTTLNNIGTALKHLDRFDEAMEKFQQSLVWSELVGNDDQIVDDLINIGAIHILDSNYAEALATFRRSLAMAHAIEYGIGLPQILSGLSQSWEGMGRLDSALHYAQASLDTARALDLSEEIVGSLEQLADVQRRLGLDALANNTLLEFIHLKDSLFNTDKALEFGQLEQSFDYERKEYEGQLAAEKAAAAQRIANFKQYLISFAVVCVIALFLVFGIRLAKSRRLRYFVVFGSLLVFFEFALVLLDSFVDGFTGGLPIPKLLANIALAALLTPANELLLQRMVRGGKQAS